MMACKEIGQVEVKQVIEWRIADFLSVAKNKNFHYYKSPTFSIENVPYFFRLRPQNRLNPEYACLYLASDVEQECTVEYNFSLKKSGNGMEKLTTRLVGDRSRCANYISLLDVHQRKAELAPRDVITITCNLNNQIIASVEQAKLDKIKSLKLIRLHKLTKKFKTLFGDKQTSDTTLKVKEKEYKAHRCVLIAWSTVFAAILQQDTLERQTWVIIITDCDPDSFAAFLEYLYCGKLEELSVCSALNLYFTANKYHVQQLKTVCVQYLMAHLTVENICQVAVLAYHGNDVTLFSAVQHFFNQNVYKILFSSEWECFLKEDSRLANRLLIEMSKVKLGKRISKCYVN